MSRPLAALTLALLAPLATSQEPEDALPLQDGGGELAPPASLVPS